jgi:hypothetical protein
MKMAERANDAGAGYLESFDRAPEALVRATRASDPLIQIAAGRVLRRIRWNGDAAVEVARALQGLRRWETEIDRQNFLPSPELRDRLNGMLDSFGEAKRPDWGPFIARAIRCLDEGIRDPNITTEQMTAIESARRFLETPPWENFQVLPDGLELLSPPYLQLVVTALFARLRHETFTDNRSEMGFENELVPLNELRGHFIPDIEALFAVYITFSGLVLTQWLDWLAQHGGADPGWVSYSHLKISWQLASVASWVGLSALLAFLDQTLDRADARHQFIALSFAELVIRVGRAGGRLCVYAGGSIAPDVVELERFNDLEQVESGRRADAEAEVERRAREAEAGEAQRRAAVEAARRAEEERREVDYTAKSRVASAGADLTFTREDLVSFGASYPNTVVPNRTFLLKVWIFQQKNLSEARARAIEESTEQVHFLAQGAQLLARMSLLNISVFVERCTIEPQYASVVWGGDTTNIAFRVGTTADVTEGTKLKGEVFIDVGGLRIGEVRFDVIVGVSSYNAFAAGNAVRTGFISYASRDRWLVLGRVHGLEKAGVKVFIDVHALRSNDRYSKLLFEQIDKADRLYLFWSRRASRSNYVEREWRYGLKTKGIDFIDPIPLTDPRRAPPPQELAGEKHFSDWVLFYERYERSLGWRERLINVLLRP